MSGRGKVYNRISYPYDLYNKPAVAVPGSCIDVKPGAAIELNASFADSDGDYACRAGMATPTGRSSCQLNPEAGVVIPVLNLLSIRLRQRPCEDQGCEIQPVRDLFRRA